MTKSIFEQLGGTYEKQGDYLLPCLTSGRLNTYLAEIDEQAEELFFRLVEQMKQAQDITERLKEENGLEWTGRLNNIRACAREIVEEEIIYI